MDGIFFASEGQTCALHVIGPETPAIQMCQPRMLGHTYELAKPIRGFSQRPPPSRISQSIRQRSDLPDPDCIVLRVGWKMRTARWRSSARSCKLLGVKNSYAKRTWGTTNCVSNHNIANWLNCNITVLFPLLFYWCSPR